MKGRVYMRGEHFHEWEEISKNVSRETSFYGLIAAATVKADNYNLRKLHHAWPNLVDEIKARISAPSGCLFVEELKYKGLEGQIGNIVVIDITPANFILVEKNGGDDAFSHRYQEAAYPSYLRGFMEFYKMRFPFVLPTKAAFLRMEEEDGWLASKAR